MEKSVPQGQKRVSLAKGRSNDVGCLLGEEIRFSTLGIEMGVSSEEGMEGTSLVPSLHEFSIRVSKEPTDVSSTETDTSHTEGQQHGLGGSKMFPPRSVVTSPDGAVSLRSSKEGAGQDKGALVVVGISQDEAGEGGLVEPEAVHVVDVSVFEGVVLTEGFEILAKSRGGRRRRRRRGLEEVVVGGRREDRETDVRAAGSAVVSDVLGHCDLGEVEDRGFVHVVPGEKIKGAASVFVELELICDATYIGSYKVAIDNLVSDVQLEVSGP